MCWNDIVVNAGRQGSEVCSSKSENIYENNISEMFCFQIEFLIKINIRTCNNIHFT